MTYLWIVLYFLGPFVLLFVGSALIDRFFPIEEGEGMTEGDRALESCAPDGMW